MNKTDVVNNSIMVIVSRYRGEKSLRVFAEELSHGLPPISHQTIRDWENGTMPSYYRMVYIFMHTHDWRHEMAWEILQVLKPEFYKPD